MKIALPIGAILLLVACASPSADDPAPKHQVSMSDPGAQAPAPAAIEAARVAIAAEPKVKDLSYNGENAVQWNVGVLDDGTDRSGYAEYLCQVIAEKGALAGRTHVRVVDIAKVAKGDDFRAANLGHVICETGDIVDA